MLFGIVRRHQKTITWRYLLLGAVALGLFSAKAANARQMAKRLMLALALFFVAPSANGGVVQVEYSASAGAGAFAETFSQLGSQRVGPVVQDRDDRASYVSSPQGDNWGRTGVVASVAAELAHSTSSSSSEFWWNRQTGAGSLYVSAGAIAGGGSYWISEPFYSRNSYADAGASANSTASIQFDQLRSVRYVYAVSGGGSSGPNGGTGWGTPYLNIAGVQMQGGNFGILNLTDQERTFVSAAVSVRSIGGGGFGLGAEASYALGVSVIWGIGSLPGESPDDPLRLLNMHGDGLARSSSSSTEPSSFASESDGLTATSSDEWVVSQANPVVGTYGFEAPIYYAVDPLEIITLSVQLNTFSTLILPESIGRVYELWFDGFHVVSENGGSIDFRDYSPTGISEFTLKTIGEPVDPLILGFQFGSEGLAALTVTPVPEANSLIQLFSLALVSGFFIRRRTKRCQE